MNRIHARLLAVKTKKTPDENCKNSTNGVAIAAAAWPVFASDEKAIPSDVKVTSASALSHRKVTIWPSPVGSVTWKASAPSESMRPSASRR